MGRETEGTEPNTVSDDTDPTPPNSDDNQEPRASFQKINITESTIGGPPSLVVDPALYNIDPSGEIPRVYAFDEEGNRIDSKPTNGGEAHLILSEKYENGGEVTVVIRHDGMNLNETEVSYSGDEGEF